MLTFPTATRDPSHAHGVDLEATFDFLNTLDHDDGCVREHLNSLDDALDWFVDRGVIHREGADRARAQVTAQPAAADRDLARVRGVRQAMREVAEAIAEHRVPSGGALDVVNRALRARQIIELVASPDGCSVDHRHVGDPVDDALARLAEPLVTELRAAIRSGSGSAPATPASGSSTTAHGPAAAAGATWPPAATVRRRRATGRGRRKRPLPSAPGWTRCRGSTSSTDGQSRSSSVLTSVAKRVIVSSSYGAP